ncbi:MAG: DUF2889 domain-containing protein [Pseudomonadota bacterium]
MPLPTPVAREPVHVRSIDCRGFARDDGLFDVEAWLVDTKAYPVANRWRGPIQPGEPIHGMGLRLTLNDDLEVVAAAAMTDFSPYPVCGAIAPAFEQLVGLRIGPGWRRAVQARLGGVRGCTHLVDLLGPLATTAMQAILPLKRRAAPPTPATRPPGHLDGCHALRRDGPVVKEHHPEWYTGDG